MNFDLLINFQHMFMPLIVMKMIYPIQKKKLFSYKHVYVSVFYILSH